MTKALNPKPALPASSRAKKPKDASDQIPAESRPISPRNAELETLAGSNSYFGAPASTQKGRERVLAVLQATERVLISHGYSGLTLRIVANEAKISHGNVQYYFPAKEGLMNSFMLYIADGYRREVQSMLDGADLDPISRFKVFVRYYIGVNKTHSVTTIFFELRAISQRNEFILGALDAMYVRYRTQMESLLSAVNPQLSRKLVRIRAALIISLIDGLMIFIGGRNARHPALESLADEAEVEILRLATAPS